MTATPSATTLPADTLSAEAKTLDEIFELASWHDRKCIATRKTIQDRLQLRGGGDVIQIDRIQAEIELADYAYARFELCGAIARAALARVPVLAPFGRSMAEHGLFGELFGEELDRFLRPIFEESGIGDRFVP